MPIDYSKWDRMDADDDSPDDEDGEDNEDENDDDDDDDDDDDGGPKDSFRAKEGEADAYERDALDPAELQAANELLVAPNMSASPPSTLPPASKAQLSAEKQAALEKALTRNGAHRGNYLWRQTKTEVEISVVLAAGTRAKELSVQLLNPADAKQRLLVSKRGANNPEFDGTLAYAVGQPDDDSDLAWEVTNFGGAEPCPRLLRVTLQKQTVPGVVIWWTRAFMHEEELDPLTFPDRQHTDRVKAQQDVWEQAQHMFRDRAAAIQPQTISIDDDAE